MATTRCPGCGLTVPYFCCEGLVCPACGYDEEQRALRDEDVGERTAPQACAPQPLTTHAGTPQHQPKK
jgi:hypothetical protein